MTGGGRCAWLTSAATEERFSERAQETASTGWPLEVGSLERRRSAHVVLAFRDR